MILSYLEACNLRVISRAEFEPAGTVNLLIGPNGSGKTSFLESIHFLATGRGFRGGKGQELIRRGSAAVNVIGRRHDDEGTVTHLGIERNGQESRVSINGVSQRSAAELARLLPVIAASPADHHELFQSTKLRRAMLDWLVFHVEPQFFGAWSRYQTALKQRNAELRSPGYRPKMLAPWEQELDEAGTAINACRQRILERWSAALQGTGTRLLDAKLSLELFPGWDTTDALRDALAASRNSDRTIGYTQLGPHRADLRMHIDALDARTYASHGQRKLVMFALRLAQLDVFRAARQHCAIVLIDDLAAELDPTRRRALVDGLYALGAQVFVTSTEAGQSGLEACSNGRLFHVERGTIRAA
ncbi:MAG TPA: DNA replication/repair protein RecF [Acidiferrobacterales bacterium]|jgi:DNA replication and repair protein RecF